ncbi:uncharacterized mitochondrial protein AtMg00810-like [Prunus dulcis]|uniref:uncharacterized mitochondrial protein AtMg00810-like n=1 Tax=Prunus dulcis TaxID=3755 RepID=UPI0014834FF5|nr:uncharacterized mitochondrial protein AtMg00810-like [Prunus dulcis]
MTNRQWKATSRPSFSSSTTENLLGDRSPEKNDPLAPRCQNQEEIEPFYEILPASALVPHQSLADEVIQEFEIKDLGYLKYFLGIEVARSKTSIFLSQMKYVMDLLTETGMLGCKPTDTLIEINHKLCEDMYREPTNKEQYQCLVGRLIYLAYTRPDIAYVGSVVSQFMNLSSVSHRNTFYQILRYLKSALGKGLLFSKNGDLEVVGYTDADWAGSIIDRCYTSGYFTFVEGNLVTWRSKKQNVVSRSSAEIEYRGMAHGVCDWASSQKSQ